MPICCTSVWFSSNPDLIRQITQQVPPTSSMAPAGSDRSLLALGLALEPVLGKLPPPSAALPS